MLYWKAVSNNNLALSATLLPTVLLATNYTITFECFPLDCKTSQSELKAAHRGKWVGSSIQYNHGPT